MRIDFLRYGLLFFAASGCSYTPAGDRSFPIVAPLPSSGSEGRTTVHVAHSGSLGTEGVAEESSVASQVTSVGGELAFSPHVSVRLNGFGGWGRHDTAASTGSPLAFGPGLVLREAFVNDRLEVLGSLDLMLALLPVRGVRCKPGLFSGDRNCDDATWFSVRAGFNAEVGMRGWVVPRVLAVYTAVGAATVPFTIGDGRRAWAGTLRAFAQLTIHPRLEVLAGVTYPFVSTSRGYGLQIEGGVRVTFGELPANR